MVKNSKFIALLFAAAVCLSVDTAFAGGIVVKVRPPAAKKEVIIARPYAHSVWIGGHWRWNARTRSHAWVGGKWVNGRRGFIWIEGRWKQTHGGWEYVEGHWRKK